MNRASVATASDPGDDATPTVFIVEQAPFIRELSGVSCDWFNWIIQNFSSVLAFLERRPVLRPSCLVLDADLPQLDILELQERVAVDLPGMPIILITGTSRMTTTVQAMAACSVKLLAKPIRDQLLTHAIANALQEGGRPSVDGLV